MLSDVTDAPPNLLRAFITYYAASLEIIYDPNYKSTSNRFGKASWLFESSPKKDLAYSLDRFSAERTKTFSYFMVSKPLIWNVMYPSQFRLNLDHFCLRNQTKSQYSTMCSVLTRNHELIDLSHWYRWWSGMMID